MPAWLGSSDGPLLGCRWPSSHVMAEGARELSRFSFIRALISLVEDSTLMT